MPDVREAPTLPVGDLEPSLDGPSEWMTRNGLDTVSGMRGIWPYRSAPTT
jgi:hypothetical protein